MASSFASTSALKLCSPSAARRAFSTSRSVASSLDHENVALFSRLSADWWSPHGETALLHRMNPVRVQFMRQKLDEVRLWEESVGRVKEPAPSSPAFLKGKEVLDVGCGGGLLTESLARLGAHVLGIDAAESSIAIARTHAAQDPGLPLVASHPTGLDTSMFAGSSPSPSLHYAHTTAEDLVAARAAAGKGGYDVVAAMEVVEHVAHPSVFLRDLSSLVKPGGHLFLSTISRTALSYLLTILVAEKFLRLVTPGTHNHSQYIRPEELVAFYRDEMRWIPPALENGSSQTDSTLPDRLRFETRGVAYLPWKSAWELAPRDAGALAEACNYFFWIRRPLE